MTRRINAAGLAHIKKWEGCKLTAYKDVAGVWTIGYGSTGKHVKPGMKITQSEADALLRKDLDRFERCVSSHVKVPLNDNQFAALVSFSFNAGTGAFQKSTLLKKLNAGDYDAVPTELMKWVNAGGRRIQGLVNRRKSEGELWNSKVPASKPVPDVAPAPKATLWALLVNLIAKLFRRA